MVTTITTTIVETIRTTTSGSLVLIAVLTLLVLLIQREILGTMRGPHAHRLAQALNVAVVPLLIIFLINFIYRVYEVVVR